MRIPTSIDLELNDEPDIPEDPRIFDMVGLPWDMRVVILNAEFLLKSGWAACCRRGRKRTKSLGRSG